MPPIVVEMSIGRWVIGLLVAATMFSAGGSSGAVPTTHSVKGRCPALRGDKPPPRSISNIQAIQFELIKRSSFNSFDGMRVARDLLRHRVLWCGAIVDRLGDDALIKLRDIGLNAWNADTLYVLSSGASDALLLALARHWQADELRWVTGRAASQLLGTTARYRILQVWWD